MKTTPAVLQALASFALTISVAFGTPAQAATPPLGTPPYVTTLDRPWVLESEFDADVSLHANQWQIIVLALEGRQRGEGVFRDNVVRFRLDRERLFSLCIPADDPHLVRLRLERSYGAESIRDRPSRGVAGKVLTHRRGSACNPVSLLPGLYTLHVYHDSRGLPDGGVVAFIQPAQSPGALQGCDYSQPEFPCYDFTAFRAQNGKFVTSDASEEPPVAAATATDVGPAEVWRVTAINPNDPPNGAQVTYQNAMGDEMSICKSGSTNIITGQCSEGVYPATFNYGQAGPNTPFQFALYLVVKPNKVPLFAGPVSPLSGDVLNYFGEDAYLFTADYGGYDCTTACDDTTPPLASGQIALYPECNFEGRAIVFAADTADLSIYDSASAAGLGIGSDVARSIRVGPSTVTRLYAGSQYAGTSIATVVNVPCLDDTVLGNDSLSSFQIFDQGVLPYIVSSQGCQNCLLPGIDLSNLVFTGYDFSGSNLVGANLASTDFTKANLSGVSFYGANTVLTNTDFAGANLECTDFSLTNVTSSQFSGNVLKEDFSCYLDLSGATLEFESFSPGVWRYINLAGAKIQNVSGQVLSTIGKPVNFSGAILSRVDLSSTLLDGANFGCAGSICTTLQATQFKGASLSGATFKNALLQGADMTSANLLEADFESASLAALPSGSPATLTGAFLRDASLIKANLTGVIADFANFYSSRSGTATASGANMTGSKWNNAYLANADFSNTQLQSTEWTQAVLTGANFDSADLSKNTTAGEVTDFSGAYLQGAVFENASVTDANFTSSYWDVSGSSALNIELQRGNLEFTGYWNDPSEPECVQVMYPTTDFPSPGTPQTSGSNICPDGNPGPCDAVWYKPQTPIEQATPASAVDPALPGTCSEADIDWIYTLD